MIDISPTHYSRIELCENFTAHKVEPGKLPLANAQTVHHVTFVRWTNTPRCSNNKLLYKVEWTVLVSGFKLEGVVYGSGHHCGKCLENNNCIPKHFPHLFMAVKNLEKVFIGMTKRFVAGTYKVSTLSKSNKSISATV